MNPNNIPTFRKVELLLRTNSEKKLKGEVDIQSIEKVEFENCGLMITGDYIILVTDDRDKQTKKLQSTGRIFNLSQVSAYKTHAN